MKAAMGMPLEGLPMAAATEGRLTRSELALHGAHGIDDGDAYRDLLTRHYKKRRCGRALNTHAEKLYANSNMTLCFPNHTT